MRKKTKNISIIVKACNDKIDILRDECANMFQVVYGNDDNQEHLTIATIYLDQNQAFLCKGKALRELNSVEPYINFIAKEVHLIHFHSDPYKNTHEFMEGYVFNINLR